MKTIKTAARCAAFFALLAFITVNLYQVLSWKDTMGITGLYRFPPDSTDVLFVGSSHSYCSVNTALLWRNHGIAARDIAEAGQVFPASYHYLREALKTQHPRVVFVELYGFDLTIRPSTGNHYRNTLNMRWSENYVGNLDGVLSTVETKAGGEDLSDVRKRIMLKFPVVHTRYSEVTRADFEGDDSKLRYLSRWTTSTFDPPEALGETGVEALTDAQRQSLDELVALARQHNFRLVLWMAPYMLTTGKMKVFNAVEQYAAENGVECQNLLKRVDELGFDFSADMRYEPKKGGHMNVYGAQKVTRYFGDLLAAGGDLPDRRGDPGYAWYDEMSREWDVRVAAQAMDEAKDLKAYAEAVDPELIDTTVICRHPEALKADLPVWSGLFGTCDDVEGVYTQVPRDRLTGVWELADGLVLKVPDDDVARAVLYEGAKEIDLKDCDLCVVTVDRRTGKVLDRTEFVGKGEKYKRRKKG